ncbi:hypothetical protein FUAX_01900 [Fulvitalea axinellae]|uniref:Outer membrane protein beta-barrel domain-containing protein n=1 Tax=Fulvitalea axinellae TaxID=1182444 RepID=A0AAU9CIE1_9BACT|nr:hypothetical protein FUAX_01900 [Fulvitalea axinellae]
MKKFTLVLAAVLFAATFAHAQFFTFGVKGGLSTSYVRFDNATSGNYTIKDDGNSFGYHAGIFAKVSLLGIFVQPEFYYSESGGDIKVSDGMITETGKIKYQKFDLPVMVGFKFLVFRVNAGPVFTLILDQSIKDLPSAFKDVKQNYNDATVGFQAGLGLDFLKRFTLDARYEGNLSKLGKSFSLPGGGHVNSDLRNNQFIFSLGYKLIR